MTDDLRTFTRNAASAFGYGDDDPATATPPENLEGDEVEQDDAEADVNAAVDAEYEATAAEFWDGLDDDDRIAAEQSESYRAQLWQSFLADRGLVVDDEDDDEETEDAGEPGGFTSAEELVEAVLANEDQLVDQSGAPISAAAWLQWAAEAPESQWIAAARAAGLDPGIRPSHSLIRQYGRGVQGAVLAESWAAHVARLKEQGRTF
jgi:hypothetical protein